MFSFFQLFEDDSDDFEEHLEKKKKATGKRKVAHNSDDDVVLPSRQSKLSLAKPNRRKTIVVRLYTKKITYLQSAVLILIVLLTIATLLILQNSSDSDIDAEKIAVKKKKARAKPVKKSRITSKTVSSKLQCAFYLLRM